MERVMMMANLADGLRELESAGLLDVLLPFILIFTVVFAVFQKTKILGKDHEGRPKKNYNVIIALVMSLAVVIPHVTGSYGRFDIVDIINGALPNISLIVVAILMFLLLVGVWGKNVDIAKSSLGGWVVIASIIIVIYIFATQAGWAGLPTWLYFLNDSTTQAAVITILVFGIIIWFVTKEDRPRGENEEGGFRKMFTNMLREDGGDR